MEQADRGDGDGGDVVGRGPDQVLDDLAEGQARQLRGLHQAAQASTDEDYVGGLHGHVGPAADGDADIGLLQCRGVVDAIADHGHPLAVFAL